MNAEDVKRLLGLQPHPREGGWFIRTYESGEAISLPRYATPRHTATAIYYLLEPDTFSEMHRLRSDEIFHHYLGAPVEMLQLHPDGTSTVHVIGKDLATGERPQLLVQRGVWQGSRLLRPEPGSFALLGCTVSPGFAFEDYEDASAAELVAQWPEEAERIARLTRR